jgi:asparagine synthase (glutamine-hydrolysing)
MCGFIGVLGDGSSLGLSIKERMAQWLDRIHYRGPDESSYYFNELYSIGFNRLSINNLLDGKQPRVLGDLVVVFNGELFNYRTLASEHLGIKLNEPCDEVGVLAQLFLRMGEHCFSMLNGQFSIAIFNNKTKRLVLARDPFGIRPLFYSKQANNRSVIFGSSLDIISSLEPRNVDIEQIKRIHTTWAPSKDRTIWKNCFQVPPGCSVAFDLKNDRVTLSTECFWDWGGLITESCKPSISRIQHDQFEQFRFEMKQAVKRQSMSDVGYASYLSGGIDSSVIAYELNQLESPVTTFSVAFDDCEYDESIKQQLMVQALHSKHHQVRITDDQLYEEFYNTVKFAEEPLFRSAPIPLRLLSREVNQSGHKVVFTGEGADEILLGYDIFREAKIKEFIRAKPESSLRYKLFDNLYQYLPQFKNKRYRSLAIDTLLADKNWGSLEFVGSRLANNWSTASFLNDASIGAEDMHALLESEMPPEYAHWDSIQAIQYFEIQNLLQGYLLSIQGDRMSMSNSVESRYPFLDLEFVKYAMLEIPQNLKLFGTSYKHILRKSYQNIVPKEIVDAPKIAYQAPEARIFFKNGQERSLLNRFLLKGNPAFEIYKCDEMRDLFSRLKKCSIDKTRGSYRDNMTAMLFMSLSVLMEKS